MFSFDKPVKEAALRVPTTEQSLTEAVGGLYACVLETTSALTSKTARYNDLLKQVLSENGGVYDDSVKLVLTESSKDVAVQVIDDAQSALSSFQQIRTSIASTLAKLQKENAAVVQQYQPLLKQLDTSKCSYTVSKYSLEKLSAAEMLTALNTCVNEHLGFSLNKADQPADVLETIIQNFQTGMVDALNCMQHDLLGAAPTFTISSFLDAAKNILVDPKATVTSYFNDAAFGTLLNLVDQFPGAEEVDAIIAELQNHVVELRQVKVVQGVDDDGQEYSNAAVVQFFVTRKIAFCQGLTYIAEILKLKCAVLEQASINYRRVIISTYNKLLRPGNVVTEAYNPSSDDTIGVFYAECAQDNLLL